MPELHRLWKNLTRPGAVWLIMAAVLWGWHAPSFYTASVENDVVHALQHSSFILAALLFWWVVLHAYGAVPERRGAGVMYLFTTAMHSGLLGALITFSPTVWYPVYAGRAEDWGISALADQQLAGTIMWVPAGMIFLFAALALLKRMIDTVPTEEGIAPQKELK
jgi:putative membrane protein